MSLRRQLLLSFGLQGLGAAAVLLATLLLGARLGPEVQGGFSHVKAEIEFIAAFAMLGLPQALFFHVKSGGLGIRSAWRWVAGATLLALPIAGLYALRRHADDGEVAIALFAVAVAAAVAHGQLRTLLLVRERTEWFNIVTALPQVLLLAGVLVAIAGSVNGLGAWPALFALAFGCSAALAAARLRGSADTLAARLPWHAVAHYGLAAWLTAALSTAAVLLVQRWVEVGPGRAALGQFTMAMTLVQVPLTPISYAAPLLLRRWMEQPGAHAARRVALAVFVALLIVAALAGLLAGRWPDLGLGAAYAGATHALALLLAGGAAEAASRVLTVQASASGLPWVAVRAETARWAVLAIGWLVLPAPGLMAVCAVWACGAWAAGTVFVAHAALQARAPS